jgi:hypothetical protein
MYTHTHSTKIQILTPEELCQRHNSSGVNICIFVLESSKLRIPVTRGSRSLTQNLLQKTSSPIDNVVSPPDMRNKKERNVVPLTYGIIMIGIIITMMIKK